MVSHDVHDRARLTASRPCLHHAGHILAVNGQSTSIAGFGEVLDEGDVVERLAGRPHHQRHREHGVEIHFEVLDHWQHPHVGLVALEDVRQHRSVVAAHGHRFDLLVHEFREANAKLPTRLAPRDSDGLRTAFPGRPEVRHHREARQIPVHVERVLEHDGRVLASPVEVLEDCGHVVVHRVDGPADHSKFGWIVPDLVQVRAKRLRGVGLFRWNYRARF